jgi:hypothetical protein
MIALGCSGWPWDWDDCFKDGLKFVFESVLGSLADIIFKAIAKVVIDAVEAIMKAIGMLWIYIPTPDVAKNTPALWIQEHTQFIVLFVAAIAVIVGAVQMVISHRGEPARDILRALITLVVVSGAGAAFAGTLITAADGFSSWIVNEAFAADDHNYTKNLLDVMDEPGGFGWLLVIFVGILMVIAGVIQLALMIVRYGMLVLLVGVLPLTAAATNTEMGMSWFKRSLAWLTSFIIYKPIAAIIYATAIKLMGQEGDGHILSIIMGVTLMVVAVVALPALLRFTSPRTS